MTGVQTLLVFEQKNTINYQMRPYLKLVLFYILSGLAKIARPWHELQIYCLAQQSYQVFRFVHHCCFAGCKARMDFFPDPFCLCGEKWSGRMRYWSTRILVDWDFSQITFWSNHMLVKSDFGQIRFWSNQILVESDFGQIIFWSNLILA
jgi:hypothetical protein